MTNTEIKAALASKGWAMSVSKNAITGEHTATLTKGDVVVMYRTATRRDAFAQALTAIEE